MEDSKPTQIKFADFSDLRQSPGWEEFLTWAGWKCERTSGGVLVSFIKSPMGKLGKIQRPKSLSEKDLAEIDELCRKNKCSVVKFEPSLSQNLGVVERTGYVKSFRPLVPPATVITDLRRSEEDLWKEISKNARQSVKKAREEGGKIEIIQEPNEEALKRFLALTTETKKDRKYTGPNLEDLKTKAKAFGKDAYLILVKDSAGKDMAGSMYFAYKEGIWYLHGGTASKARKTTLGYLLMWESTLYFKKQGFEFLDYDGVDDDRFPAFTKTWGRFSHFKEKFSKERVLFPAPYIKIYNPLLKIMTKLRGKNTL